MIIETLSHYYRISFDYDSVIYNQVKKIPGARWVGSEKYWLIPLDRTPEVNRLRAMFTQLNDKAASLDKVDGIPELPDLTVDIPLKMQLFPYQAKGVAYNILHQRSLIGDQPGLGKTAQAIASVMATNAFPCLVICPATLKYNWKNEIEKWTGKGALILCDRIKTSWPQYYFAGQADFFIVNYESLKTFFVTSIIKAEGEPLKLAHISFRPTINLFKSLIVDESHRCKDGGTRQAKLVMGIARAKQYIYLLSGTPLVNSPEDLISQLHIMGRLGEFGGYEHFMKRYCSGPRKASNLKELYYKLYNTCFYRREKKDVLTDLPDKIRQVIRCDITNRAEYDKAQDEFVEFLKVNRGCTDDEIAKKLRGEIMVKMGILKGLSARGKIDAVREAAQEIIDAGEKVIIFCHLKEVAQALLKAFPKAGLIAGGVSQEERQAVVDRFQKDPGMNVVVCSIKAAGVGLTLTASSRVLFVEFPWTFADCEQCEDRAHRIGQKDSVYCGYFLGRDTIDAYCYDIIQNKKDISETVTGARVQVVEQVIDDLLQAFGKKELEAA